MQLFAPAKINLSFRILNRREDGFHEIDTLMAPLALGDELTIEPNESGGDLIFTTDDPSLPAGEDNLVVRAARAYFAEIGEEARVRIRLRKKIPHGAGLGGGSSDAASTLLGLNEIYAGKIAPDRLAKIAAVLGSDVPFFLVRSPARCRGRGETVTPLEVLPEMDLLLLKPTFGVPTPWAYQHWQDSRPLPGVGYGPQKLGAITLQNDLERPVFEKYIFLARLKTWLRLQPEVAGALLSGSGSTVLAVLRAGKDSGALAERAQAEMDPLLWICATRTLPPR